eukprot:TRINITY_DN5585_c0_g1_i1.p1 TRINITY_DN5585_c0_g1~~TRINITY_DN5585_c0_g1_i1.p1  ORF type:complete len:413 (-),score=123.06 TRINITY_DN5585_c0_g1_i1:133-1203(-)
MQICHLNANFHSSSMDFSSSPYDIVGEKTSCNLSEKEEEESERFTAEVLVISPSNPLESVLTSNMDSNSSPASSSLPLSSPPLLMINNNVSEENSGMDLEEMEKNVNQSTFYDENKTMTEAESNYNNNNETINANQNNHSESADSVSNENNKNNLKIASKNRNFQLESGVRIIAHPSKVAKGGEDAFFVSPYAVGVADGVGGWNEIGIDPSLYSRKMMEGADKSVKEWKEEKELDPVVILREAFDYVTSHNVIGSTTVCILSVENGFLKAANLGDSGFLLVRGEQIIYRTKEQQFSFNFPYQIGTNSDCLPESHADRINLEVKDGDCNRFDNCVYSIGGKWIFKGCQFGRFWISSC